MMDIGLRIIADFKYYSVTHTTKCDFHRLNIKNGQIEMPHTATRQLWHGNLFTFTVVSLPVQCYKEPKKNVARNCFSNAGACGSGDKLGSVSRDFLNGRKMNFMNETKEVNDLTSLDRLSFLSEVS